MKPKLQFIGVCNDKGGVGKSIVAALITEQLGSDIPTTLVEIEQRAAFTQELYQQPAGVELRPILLMSQDPDSGRNLLSLRPLDTLAELLPQNEGESRRIIVDFGASACQSFLFWARDDRGLQPFRVKEFNFVFLVPVQGADPECADFFNANAPSLLKLGKVVLVRNHIHGPDFSHLDQGLTQRVHSLNLPFRGRPLIDEIARPGQRLTFRQLAGKESASRRGRLDAKTCDREFSEQFDKLRPELGL